MINRSLHLALAIALCCASVALATETRLYKGYEEPPYEVTASEGDYEIRRYDDHLLAEVAVRGSRSDAVGRGFRVLAGYIFGDNADGQKVAMTVPVAQTPADTGSDTGVWTVQFMMPSDYVPETLPEPKNPAIRIGFSGPSEQAVVRFSGRWSDTNLSAQTEALRAWAEGRGLTVTSEPRYYFYDGPFTLPFARRNEIAFLVQ